MWLIGQWPQSMTELVLRAKYSTDFYRRMAEVYFITLLGKSWQSLSCVHACVYTNTEIETEQVHTTSGRQALPVEQRAQLLGLFEIFCPGVSVNLELILGFLQLKTNTPHHVSVMWKDRGPDWHVFHLSTALMYWITKSSNNRRFLYFSARTAIDSYISRQMRSHIATTLNVLF